MNFHSPVPQINLCANNKRHCPGGYHFVLKHLKFFATVMSQHLVGVLCYNLCVKFVI